MGPAPEEKLPKDATPGRLLTGSLTLAKLSGAAGNGDAPGAPVITYVVRSAALIPKTLFYDARRGPEPNALLFCCADLRPNTLFM